MFLTAKIVERLIHQDVSIVAVIVNTNMLKLSLSWKQNVFCVVKVLTVVTNDTVQIANQLQKIKIREYMKKLIRKKLAN